MSYTDLFGGDHDPSVDTDDGYGDLELVKEVSGSKLQLDRVIELLNTASEEVSSPDFDKFLPPEDGEDGFGEDLPDSDGDGGMDPDDWLGTGT